MSNDSEVTVKIKDARLVGPAGEEMADVVMAALVACDYAGSVRMSEVAQAVVATRRNVETWGGKQFEQAIRTEISWKGDDEPPEIFSEIYGGNDKAAPLVVTMKFTALRGQTQEELREHAKRLWSELKARAKAALYAIERREKPTNYGSAKWADLAALEKEGYVEEDGKAGGGCRQDGGATGCAGGADGDDGGNASEGCRQDGGATGCAGGADGDDGGNASEGCRQDGGATGCADGASKRFFAGYVNGRTISVPERATEAHVLVAGPSGSGKSRRVLIPNLIRRIGTSVLVTEVTAGEDMVPVLYSHTAGYRAAQGQRVYYFNPTDLRNSTRFNLIDMIGGTADAIYYANLIVMNTTARTHIGDQIWQQSETHLLTSLLLYVWGLGGKERAVEGSPANVAHVRQLLRHGPISLYRLIERTGIEEAQEMFEEFLKNSSANFRLGVFSGLIQRLNSWLDPAVVKLTQVTDFEPAVLERELFSFYLAYAVNRPDYKPVMTLLLNFLMRMPLRRKFEKPLAWVLDEFAAYGNVPRFDDVHALIRNRGIGVVLAYQNEEQLAKVYSPGEAEIIFANTETKLIFATSSPKTQKQVSTWLGEETREHLQVSSAGQVSRRAYGAPLLSAGEVGTEIKEGQVLMVRTRRDPVILDCEDAGRYADFPRLYPVEEKAERVIEEAIFEGIARGERVVFPEREAERQAREYQSLWGRVVEAGERLDGARRAGATRRQLKQFEYWVELARKDYRDFVVGGESGSAGRGGGAGAVSDEGARGGEFAEDADGGADEDGGAGAGGHFKPTDVATSENAMMQECVSSQDVYGGTYDPDARDAYDELYK